MTNNNDQEPEKAPTASSAMTHEEYMKKLSQNLRFKSREIWGRIYDSWNATP